MEFINYDILCELIVHLLDGKYVKKSILELINLRLINKLFRSHVTKLFFTSKFPLFLADKLSIPTRGAAIYLHHINFMKNKKLLTTFPINQQLNILYELSMGNLSEIKNMLMKNADCESIESKRTLLHRFCDAKSIIFRTDHLISEIIKTLINSGANVNALDKQRKSPLYLLILNHNISSPHKLELIELLLIAGANPNVICNHGGTLLHLAISRQYTNIIHLLLKYGANANIRNKSKGATALHSAVAKFSFVILRMLLPYSDINAKDNDGNTPLHKLLSNKKLSLLKDGTLIADFIRYGADVSIRNKLGETPLYIYVKSQGSLLKYKDHISSLLFRAGASLHDTDIDDCSVLDIAKGYDIKYELLESYLMQDS